MTPSMEAAAMHGLATNAALPVADRLQCALQALEFYEAQLARYHELHDELNGMIADPAEFPTSSGYVQVVFAGDVGRALAKVNGERLDRPVGEPA